MLKSRPVPSYAETACGQHITGVVNIDKFTTGDSAKVSCYYCQQALWHTDNPGKDHPDTAK